MPITIFQKDQFEPIKQAGSLAGQVLDILCKSAKPGISTWDLDKIAEEWIFSQGAIPTFKGYRGFPACLCTSVNHEVVHGIPNKSKVLKEGDIISLDIGVTVREKFNGKEWDYIGDTARTVIVGEASPQIQKLLKDTDESLKKGIELCKTGFTVKDISTAVHKVAVENKYGIVRMFGGHGIGPNYHDDPFIPNWPEYFLHTNDTKLTNGMLLCIEPMFNLGSDDVRLLKDNWTVVTVDHKYSAHFEHTILVTDSGSFVTTSV